MSNFLKYSGLKRSQQIDGGDGAQHEQSFGFGVLESQRVWSWGAEVNDRCEK